VVTICDHAGGCTLVGFEGRRDAAADVGPFVEETDSCAFEGASQGGQILRRMLLSRCS
jgi:hypothetical protein